MGMVENQNVLFSFSALIKYHRQRIEKFELSSEKLLLREWPYNRCTMESPAELYKPPIPGPQPQTV